MVRSAGIDWEAAVRVWLGGDVAVGPAGTGATGFAERAVGVVS